jgi:hypothetical protein
LLGNFGPRLDAACIAALPQMMDFLTYSSRGAIPIPHMARGSINLGGFIWGYSHFQESLAATLMIILQLPRCSRVSRGADGLIHPAR